MTMWLSCPCTRSLGRVALNRPSPAARGHWLKGSGSARPYSEGHRRASDTYTDTVESFDPTPIAHLDSEDTLHANILTTNSRRAETVSLGT